MVGPVWPVRGGEGGGGTADSCPMRAALRNFVATEVLVNAGAYAPTPTSA